MPVQSNFIFDTDEGQELIKAMLYDRGFALYDPIWSDQPPLLTVFLSAWFKVFGSSVFSARLLILCFATLLIWAFFQTLKICEGQLPAIIGTLFLALSCNFLRSSVSVMMGLPSLAWAMLSVYALMLYLQRAHSLFLLLSGLALGISLQFKMFTLFLIPLQVLFLLSYSPQKKSFSKTECSSSGVQEFRRIQQLPNSFLKTAIASLLWLLAVLISFGAIGFTFDSLRLDSIFTFHITHDLKDVFVRENSIADVSVMFLQDLDFVFLAALGIRAILKKRDKWHKFPLVWLATATLILLNHKPIWYHHYLLLSIPIAWLASYGIAVALPELKKLQHFQFRRLTAPSLAVSLCILTAIAAPIKLGAMQWQNRIFLEESQEKVEVVERILEYQKETRWVFTDNPIYAFYANLPVPPEIAVLSRKRVASGEVTREYLYDLLHQYQPEQVILERFPEVYEPIRPYLEANYFQIEERGSQRHYVLKSLRKKIGIQE